MIPIITNRPTKSRPPLPLEARYVSIPAILQVGVAATVTYTYYSSNGRPENNRPPLAEDLVLSGTTTVGQVLTATIVELRIPNGSTAGTHTYRWYRCTDAQESNDILLGETNSSYTLVEADSAKLIRVECNPVQVGGLNPMGETIYSHCSDRIASSTFNPVYANTWESVYFPVDLETFNTSGRWANNAVDYDGKSIVRDGVRALPTYDGTEGAMKFIRASLQCASMPKRNPSWAAPLEIMIRFKLNALVGNQHLLAFTASQFIYVTSIGALNVSGGVVPGITLTTGKWYLLKVILNGGSTTVQLNNGTPVGAASSTAGIGIGSARIGCSFAASSSTFLDGWISHILISNALLISPNSTNTVNWFIANYPWTP